MKLNGRDKSNLTVNEDEINIFIAKADQNNDAIKTAGKYTWFEQKTEKINKKTTKVSVTIIATPTILIVYIK